jgi:hypothetical protein
LFASAAEAAPVHWLIWAHLSSVAFAPRHVGDQRPREADVVDVGDAAGADVPRVPRRSRQTVRERHDHALGIGPGRVREPERSDEPEPPSGWKVEFTCSRGARQNWSKKIR